jgi:hypothetical protein
VFTDVALEGEDAYPSDACLPRWTRDLIALRSRLSVTNTASVYLAAANGKRVAGGS